MLRSSITMQKEAARHVYMPDCFFFALNIACETRIFLIHYPFFRRELLGAASDERRESALVVPQLYNEMRKPSLRPALSDNFQVRPGRGRKTKMFYALSEKVLPPPCGVPCSLLPLGFLNAVAKLAEVLTGCVVLAVGVYERFCFFKVEAVLFIHVGIVTVNGNDIGKEHMV